MWVVMRPRYRVRKICRLQKIAGGKGEFQSFRRTIRGACPEEGLGTCHRERPLVSQLGSKDQAGKSAGQTREEKNGVFGDIQKSCSEDRGEVSERTVFLAGKRTLRKQKLRVRSAAVPTREKKETIVAPPRNKRKGEEGKSPTFISVASR